MKNLITFLTLFVFALGMAQPTTNAPVPTKAASDVVSVFSDTYTNIATNYNPGWGQSGAVNTTFLAVAGSGNNILAYTNFNYQGTDVTSTNLAAMENLHIDVWSNTTGAVLKVSPINNGSGASEFLVNVPLTSGAWNSIDLPKSLFTGMTWDSVFQLKFDGQAGTTPSAVYLDNIYFWKAPIVAASDATLSALTVNGTSVTGFSPSTLTYTHSLPNGTTTVPTVAATTTQTTSTKVITQATALPGSATVLVTAQDGTTKTYTVNFVLAGPNAAAPTPTRPAANVISLFSNAYNNITVDSWSAPWDDSTVTDIQVAGNDVKKIDFTNFLGIDFSGAGHHINLTNATHYHMDVWVDATPVGYVYNTKVVNFAGGAGSANEFLLDINAGTTPNLVAGQWNSIDVPITQFTGPTARQDIAQLLFISNLPTAYVDNIYFYNPTSALAVKDIASTKKMSIYPNPAKAGEMVNVSEEASAIELYNVSGQLLKTANAKSISTQGLNSGLYILKVKDKNQNVSSGKLIVK